MLFNLIDDTVWTVSYPVKLGPFILQSTMTVVRLRDATLWVHSPAPVSAELKEQLDALGSVSAIVASNAFHHINFRSFSAAYPDAECYICPALQDKGYTDGKFKVLEIGTFKDDFVGIRVDGVPVLNEIAWFHKTSNALIVTDCLIHFDNNCSRFSRWLAKLYGANKKLAFPRTLKWFMVKDRNALHDSFMEMLWYCPKIIIPCHQSPVVHNAEKQLRAVVCSVL